MGLSVCQAKAHSPRKEALVGQVDGEEAMVLLQQQEDKDPVEVRLATVVVTMEGLDRIVTETNIFCPCSVALVEEGTITGSVLICV